VGRCFVWCGRGTPVWHIQDILPYHQTEMEVEAEIDQRSGLEWVEILYVTPEEHVWIFGASTLIPFKGGPIRYS